MTYCDYGSDMDVANFKSEIKCLLPNIDAVSLSGHVCCDSRQVAPGDVFVAIKGPQADGHDFIEGAIGRGAALVIAQKPVHVEIPSVVVPDSALMLGQLAHAAHDWPGNSMVTLGITGTNGKTTIAYLTRAILNAAGLNCGMIGTVEYDLGKGQVTPADNTTPGAPRIAQMMGQMRENGLAAMVMECSSHGLHQQRTAGISFNAAAFSNLTGDHLDYHGDRDSYLTAKSKLFEELPQQSIAVLNIADEASKYIAQKTPAQVWWYGIDSHADINSRIVSIDMDGSELEMSVLGERINVHLPLIGRHNVSNFLAAVGLVRAAGVNLSDIAQALDNFKGTPGRLEKIDCGQNFTVLVDYAHTDDALRHALVTISELTTSRVIVVFGCGGQRDQSKRPRMGQVAQELADIVVVTNDNPRQEDPQAIIDQIKTGFIPTDMKKISEIPDRREAITFALQTAQPTDVVLIAGKGHESYQLIGEKRFDFDDRKVAQELLSVLTLG